MDTRKRGGGEFANGIFKKSKPAEINSLASGVGSKLKPCTKFFSMAGCPFGENCHFLHYVPGGYSTVAQMMNLAPAPTSRIAVPVQNGSAPSAVKSKMCNKYKTAEGCKFGDKCHFAHGEWELGKPIASSQEDPRSIGMPMAAIPNSNPSHFGTRGEVPVAGLFGRAEAPAAGPAASFGASATAKISVDASVAGAVIGKGGVNTKEICRQTGAKLAIREHESDLNLRNIELEGTFEQIQQASALLRELIVSITSSGKTQAVGGGPGGNFKTKLCDNFSQGSCTFGERCHFAHGAAELRKTGGIGL